MICRDFEIAWQSRLDARDTSFEAGPPEEHARTCRACAAKEAGFERLLRAVQTWGPPPQPSADLAARVLAASARLPEPILPMPWSARPSTRWLSAAAAVLLVGAAGLWAALRPVVNQPEAPSALASKHPEPPGDEVGPSLAVVTTATLDLAERTSAPAARLGLLVLNSARTPTGLAAPDPTSEEPSGEMLRSVSDRVSSGVRPISGSARRAFGFLLGPASEPRPADTPPKPRRRGA